MYEDARYVAVPAGTQPMVIFVTINGVPSSVPCDPANADYVNLMELEREGKIVIQPADGEQQ